MTEGRVFAPAKRGLFDAARWSRKSPTEVRPTICAIQVRATTVTTQHLKRRRTATPHFFQPAFLIGSAIRKALSVAPRSEKPCLFKPCLFNTTPDEISMSAICKATPPYFPEEPFFCLSSLFWSPARSKMHRGPRKRISNCKTLHVGDSDAFGLSLNEEMPLDTVLSSALPLGLSSQTVSKLRGGWGAVVFSRGYCATRTGAV
jgi:hypothetical protein